MFNGYSYQLVTQNFIKDWFYVTPVISKTEFNRLLKEDVLSKHYLVKKLIVVTMYDFIKE